MSGEPRVDARHLLANLPGMAYRAGAERARPLSFVSEGALQLTGRPSDAFASGLTGWLSIVHPDDVPAVEQAVESALRENSELRVVHRIVHSSGAVRWVMDQARLVTGAQGQPVAFEGVVTDVTQLRCETEAARECESRFCSTFDKAAIGLAQLDLKVPGRWLRVNDRLCELTGYSRDELLARSLRDITHPNDVEADLELTRRLLSGEVPTLSLERRYLRKDGQVFWACHSRSLLRTPAGEPDCAISVIEDITDRKLAEASLRETEQWLNLAQAAGGVGVFDWPIAAGAARCSDFLFEVLGRRPPRPDGTITEREAAGWVHPEDRRRALTEIRAALFGAAERLSSEFRVVGEDGNSRWVSYQAEIRRDPEGAPLRVLGVLQDITIGRRSQQQLRRAHERLSMAQRAGKAGLWDWNFKESPIAFLSAEYRELFGLPPDEPVTYEQWLERVCPEDRPRMAAYTRQLFEKGGEYSNEFRIDHPTRGQLWLRASGNIACDAQGKPERSSGVILDITALKLAEQALRESEQRFRKIFENACTGIAITDMNGRFEQCNPAYAALLGFSEEELRQREFRALVHPDDRDANLRKLRRLVAGELPSFEIENRDIRKDGEPIWVRKFVSVLTDEAGKPTHLVALVTDMTERRRVERTLQMSEQRLRNVIDSMFAFVWMLAPDGRLIEANRAPVDILGLERADVLCRPFWDCPWWSYDPAVRARLEAAFDRAVGGEVIRYDETIAIAGGKRLEIDFQLQPVFDDGHLVYVIPSAVDITDRKRAEDAIKDSHRRKDEFLATLAHELRNPLAPLRTGFEVLRASPDRGRREHAREMMERQLEHMVRLIDDLLDVSRISLGKLELRQERVPLQVVIQHAIETASPVIAARNHVLSTCVPDEPIWIDGDLTRLAQVLGNLLNNSSKYTPPGGHLELAVAVEDGQAVIRVTDDGLGISPQVLPSVFDLFAQGPNERGQAQGGLGIGLFLVRRLVELHGGTITAASPGPNRGSTFTVRLPIAARPRPEADEDAEKPDSPARRRRILVVDDNEDAAELLATVLELRGYDTRVAHDGPRGLELAREFHPEVAFLDIGLPGMSGHELARRLRADPALEGLVLVALTGWGGLEDKRRAREAGFNHHLTKPIEIAAIDRVLAGFPPPEEERPHAG